MNVALTHRFRLANPEYVSNRVAFLDCAGVKVKFKVWFPEDVRTQGLIRAIARSQIPFPQPT